MFFYYKEQGHCNFSLLSSRNILLLSVLMLQSLCQSTAENSPQLQWEGKIIESWPQKQWNSTLLWDISFPLGINPGEKVIIIHPTILKFLLYVIDCGYVYVTQINDLKTMHIQLIKECTCSKTKLKPSTWEPDMLYAHLPSEPPS